MSKRLLWAATAAAALSGAGCARTAPQVVTERGLELRAYPEDQPPPCGCPHAALWNRSGSPIVFFPLALGLEVPGAEHTPATHPSALWTGAGVLRAGDRFDAQWTRPPQRNKGRTWSADPGTYRVKLRYEVPADIVEQAKAAGETLPDGDVWVGSITVSLELVVPPPQVVDKVDSFMFPDVVDRLGEPAARKIFNKTSDSQRMPGHGSSYFELTPVGGHLEILYYPDVYGTVEVYLTHDPDGSLAAGGWSFVPHARATPPEPDRPSWWPG